MTKKAKKRHKHWHIKVPKKQFSKPMFHAGEQVGVPHEDDQGRRYYDIGKIIGMQYGASGDQLGKWYYLIRYLKCDYNPSLVGSDDRNYIEESRLVVDNTDLNT